MLGVDVSPQLIGIAERRALRDGTGPLVCEQAHALDGREPAEVVAQRAEQLRGGERPVRVDGGQVVTQPLADGRYADEADGFGSGAEAVQVFAVGFQRLPAVLGVAGGVLQGRQVGLAGRGNFVQFSL